MNDNNKTHIAESDVGLIKKTHVAETYVRDPPNMHLFFSVVKTVKQFGRKNKEEKKGKRKNPKMLIEKKKFIKYDSVSIAERENV